MDKPARSSVYIRNLIFGIEDSLVSTAGLVAGVDVGSVTHSAVLLTAFVYICVGGFSMAVGSFLSEESAQEYETGKEAVGHAPLWGGLVMFASCIIGGLLPTFPYLILGGMAAFIASVVVSLVTLALLGTFHARRAGVGIVRHALKMMLLGGLAIVVGVVVGRFFKA